MKSIAILSVIASLSAAVPVTVPVTSDRVALEPRQAGSDTRNDLTNGSPCKAATVIFARGTTESGNVGSIAGPPLFNALGSAFAVQGVDYPADIPGFLAGGDANGSKTMASLVNQVRVHLSYSEASIWVY